MSQVRACPACGGQDDVSFGRYRDEEYFTSSEDFEYWQWRRCATVFLHPLPVDRLAEIYPKNYYSFQPGGGGPLDWVKQKLDAAFFGKILKGIPGSKLRALDVGGGTGWLLDILKSLDPRIDFTQVVDLDPAAGAIARGKGHAYACQRVETFRSPEPFDVVMMLNLIEHVEGPREVLVKIGKLLSPDGIVLIKTPNIDAADARAFRSSYWAGMHVPRHWTLFTRASFESMLDGTGLRTVQFSYTQGAPFWAASTLASWHRRGWVDISSERPAVYHPLFGVLGAAFAAFDFARAPFAPTSQMFFVLGKS